MKKKDFPETLCAVPWVNVSLDVNGSMRPCCKFEQIFRSERQLGFLNESNLAELWNSKQMIQLRREFRSGKKPKECSACWNEEAAGIKSLRQEFLEGRVRESEIDFDNFVPEAPKTLDLKVSNTCNLKCRICGPVASSLLLKEYVDSNMDWSDGFLERNRVTFAGNKITRQPKNLETFKKWLPHIEHLELFGGEPLLSQENRDIERMLIESGRAPDVSLLYNTNATVFKESMVKTWKQFKKVQICLSVDDVGQRQEYERYPSNWNTIQDNVRSYASIKDPKIEIYLFCTVNNFNVWYLPEFVQWALENAPNVFFRFNFLHNDAEFCITNLPSAIKDQVRFRLRDAIKRLDFSGHVEAQDMPNKLESVISFMDSRVDDAQQWAKFQDRVFRFDVIRKQNFRNIFSEFNSAIRENALENQSPGISI